MECLCWVLLKCGINEKWGYSSDNKGGLELDSEDAEVLKLACWLHGAWDVSGEISESWARITVVTRVAIMVLRATVCLWVDRFSLGLLLCQSFMRGFFYFKQIWWSLGLSFSWSECFWLVIVIYCRDLFCELNVMLGAPAQKTILLFYFLFS